MRTSARYLWLCAALLCPGLASAGSILFIGNSFDFAQGSPVRLNGIDIGKVSKVELSGSAVCHEGYRSCFFRRVHADGSLVVDAERVHTTEELYGAKNPGGAKRGTKS